MKTLAHWEAALERAREAATFAHRNVLAWRSHTHAPTRWLKLPTGRWWWTVNSRKFKRRRLAWVKLQRLSAMALREFSKADRRASYIQERIDVLSKQTAWDRVLRRPVV